MDFLTQQNRRVAGKKNKNEEIWATGKNVVVIGGGDTGSDCVGTSNRHGAKSVTQIEIMPKPPTERTASMPWPSWPMILRTSTSHEEGCERQWSIVTKEFVADGNGHLSGIKIAEVQMNNEPGKPMSFEEVASTEKIIPCELALLAMGFLHTQKSLPELLGVTLDERGNIKCTRYQTSKENIFAAGDARRGQSLVVWAISEGREAARALDRYLMHDTLLEAKEVSLLSTIIS
ncbi:MAG: FAD-dependent oxidoreductase, partial [Cytophagales bacterium]